MHISDGANGGGVFSLELFLWLVCRIFDLSVGAGMYMLLLIPYLLWIIPYYFLGILG